MCLAETLLRELILSVRLVARVFSAKLSLGEGSKSMPWKPEENGLSYSRWSPRMPEKRRNLLEHYRGVQGGHRGRLFIISGGSLNIFYPGFR